MTTKENQTESSFITALVRFLQNLALLTEEIVELAKLELRLAGKSLALIIAFYCAIAFFFLSAWFFLLAALAVLLAAKFGWLFSLLMVAGFNFVLILVMVMLIAKYKRYLTFPATRRQLNLNGGNHEVHTTRSIEKNPGT